VLPHRFQLNYSEQKQKASDIGKRLAYNKQQGAVNLRWFGGSDKE
jgi:hypothetical protein